MKLSNTILMNTAKRSIALLLVFVMLFGYVPEIKIDSDGKFGLEFVKGLFALTAEAAEEAISGSSGTWIEGMLTYSYKGVASSTDGTPSTTPCVDGTSLISVNTSGNTITLTANSSKYYTTTSGSGCNATTNYFYAATVTNTVTVTNSSGCVLKVTTLETDDRVTVNGISQGVSLKAGATFTISVTATPASNSETSASNSSGSVTIVVEEMEVDNKVVFLAPQNIGGAVPGSYTITSDDGKEYNIGSDADTGTNASTILTNFTLTASANEGFTFAGWYVNDELKSTDATYSDVFVNETNIVQPAFNDNSVSDPLMQIAYLDSDDTSVSKYDVAVINSFYNPSDYATPGATLYQFPNEAAPYSSFKGKQTSSDNSWDTVAVDNTVSPLKWAASGTAINSSYSDTSYGDNASFGNTAGAAKTCATVLQIKANQTLNISFDYSVAQTYDLEGGTTYNENAFFYSLISDSEAPTLAELKADVRWGSNETDNSGKNAFSGHFSETIEKDEYLYLYFFGFGCNYRSALTGNKTQFPYSFEAQVSDFVMKPVSSTYTLQSGSITGAGDLVGGGSVSINNTNYAVGSNGLTNSLSEINEGQSMNLAVTSVPSGYAHIGWRVVEGNTTRDVFTQTYGYTMQSDVTVYALFSPKVTVTAGSNGFSDATYKYTAPNGSEVNGANQYIARNSTGTVWYKSLSDAFASETTVVLATNVVFKGNFTLAQGKTLSVPHSLGDVATTTLQQETGVGVISKYITATIDGTMTVAGNLVASARQSTDAGQNGNAFGTVGNIEVNGSVIVESTGVIYAYGIVDGSGSINVKASGAVYELMEIRDMRDIYGLISHATKKDDYKTILPFSCYYINTNLATTTYEQGARLYALYFVNLNQVTSDGTVPIIGPYDTSNSSLFMIEEGNFTKRFVSTEKKNQIQLIANEGSSIQTGKFEVTVTAKMVVEYTITINTSETDMPIGAGYQFEVEKDASLQLNSNFKFLPGAVLKIDEGGTLTVASGKKLFLYRGNDYDYRPKGTEEQQGFTVTGYPVWYLYPTGVTTAASDLGSAQLIVNGTIDCQGGVYVTNQSTGLTKYNDGYNYLTGTGSIKIASELGNTSFYEQIEKINADSSDTSAAARTSIACVPIMGITDYTMTEDNGQDGYTSLTAGTWYGWKNGDANIWSTSLPVALSYNANGGTGTAPASVKVPGGTTVTVAENPFTRDNYTFIGWNTEADGTGTDYGANSSITLNSDLVLYAQWKANSFTVTFDMQDHGQQIEKITVTEAGGKITAPEDPEESGWFFGGWYKEAECVNKWNFSEDGVSEDTVLYAKWTEKATLATVDFTVTDNNTTYDGTAKDAIVSVADGISGMGAITVEYYLDGAKVENPTNAGQYTIKINVTEGDAYKSITGLEVGILTINKASLTVTANSMTITYGDAPTNDGVSYSGFVNGESESALGGTLAFTYNYSQNGDVGEYTITPDGLTSNNYDISFIDGTLTVAQKELTLNWGENSFTYDKQSHVPAASIDGTLSGDDVSIAVSGAQTDAGNYVATASLTGAKAGNYKLAAANSQRFTINKKPVTVSGVSASSKVYDGTVDATVTGTASLDGVISGDTVTVKTGTAAFADKNVGTGKKVTFSGFDLEGESADNYELSAQPQSVTADITAKPVTITELDVSDKSYDGTTTATVTRTAVIDGLVSGDAVTVKAGTAAFEDAAVGTDKTVTFTGYSLEGDDAENYILSAQPASVTANITAKSVTIGGLSVSDKTYDGTTTAKIVGPATLVGVEDGDIVTIIPGTAAFETANAGTGKSVIFSGYSIAGEDAGNYTLSAQPASVTADISKASLEVTAKPKTVTYGDAPANDGVTYSGFVNGETESVLGGELAYDYTYAQFDNVGNSYIITPKGLTSDNYTITFKAGTLTVVQKTVGLEWNESSFIYNGNEQIPTANATGTVNGDAISVTVDGAKTNAGTYTATAKGLTGDKAGNYILSGELTQSFTIAPKAITVKADDKSKVYDNSEDGDPALTATVVGAVVGDTIDYTLSRDEGQGVGNYIITVTAGVNPNYTVNVETGTFSITPKPVTVTVDEKSKTYGESDPTLTATVTELVGEETLNYSLTREEGENAGTYNITVTWVENPNYQIDVVEGKFTINKRSATVTADEISKIYGETEPILTATVEGTVRDDVLNYTLTRAEGENVGEYIISVALGENPNYDVTATNGTFRIEKKPVIVTAVDQTKVYGEDDPELTATVEGLVGTDVLNYTLSRETGENAGEYTIAVTAGVNPNYTVNVEPGTFSITKKSVTVTVAAKSKVYGAEDPDLTATVDGLVEGDSLNYQLARAEGENAGEYIISVTLGENPNYDVSVTGSTFTIEKKVATVKADPTSKIYGDADPELAATVEGVVEGESLNYTLTRAGGENAGTYDITVTVVDNPNYDVTVTGSTFTIEKKAASVKAEPKSKIYGDIDPDLTAIVEGVVEGDSLNYTLSRVAGEDVGTYNIIVTLGANPNYAVSWENSTFRVALKIVTVTADAKVKTYGEADPELTVTITGLSAEDPLDYSLTRVEGENVGTYAIKVVLGENHNYDVTAIDGTLTINQRAATVTANDTGKIYGDGDPELSATVEGLVGNDSLNYTLIREAGENVGSYDIVVTPTDNPNYDVTAVDGTFQIEKKSVTATAVGQTKVYGTGDPELTATVEGMVGTDVLNYTLSREAGENVGDYTITVTPGQNPNYTVATVSGTLSITKATATVTPDAVSKSYGETEPGLTATVTGLIGEDTLNYTLMREAGENAGTYTITVEPGENHNYEVIANEGIFTINKKTASVTANDAGKIYGEIDPALTAAVDGTVGSDVLSYHLARAEGENVGEYIISVTLGDNPNYEVSVTNAAFTIDKKVASVKADQKSKIYGDADPDLTATVEGLVGDDSLNYTLTRGTGENVGSYDITVTLGNNPNYDVAATNSTFLIEKRPVTVTAVGQTKVYGEGDPELSTTVEGVAGTDALDYTVARETGENVGEYTITVTPGSNPNYAVTAVNGTLSITRATATVTAADKTKVYGENDPALSAEVTGLKNGDALNVISYALSRGEGENVGDYAIIPAGAAVQGNYDVVFVPGTLTITRAAVTVTADDKSKIYFNEEPVFTASVSGLKNGDADSVIAYSISRTEGEEVGTYTITPAGEAVQGNYSVTFVPGTFTVIAPTASLNVNGTVSYFGSLADAIAAIPSGSVATVTMMQDDTITGNTGLKIEADKNVVLDLNGHTVQQTLTEAKGSTLLTNYGVLTVTDTSENADGKLLAYGENKGDSNFGYGNYTIENCGTLNIQGGTVECVMGAGACYAINNNSTVSDAILTVSGGTVKSDRVAIRQFCNSTTNENTVNVTGGEIVGGNTGLWIQLPNSDASKAVKANLNMSGGTIRSESAEGYAFYDYSSGNAYTNVHYEISGGTLEGGYVYSYGADIDISGGVFNAQLCNAGGNLEISDGTFNGYVYAYCNTDISGGTFNDWVCLNGNENGEYSISGGEFYGVWEYGTAAGYISGGIYTVEPEAATVAQGLAATARNEDGKYVIGEAIAEIGAIGYISFEAALASAEEGDTITILKDFTVDASKTAEADRIVITKPVTIDFGEYTMYVPGSLEPTSNWAALYVDADTTVKATTGGINCLDKDNGEIGVYTFNVSNGATLTIESGSYHGGGTIAQAKLGTVIVTGGTFTATAYSGSYGMNFMFNCNDAAYQNGTSAIEIKGGTFVGFDPQNNKAEGENTRFTPDGYVALDADEDGTFVVKEGYVVTFDANGGETTPAEQRIEKNNLISEPTTERTGYTFDAWTLDGAAYDFAFSPVADIELAATWTPIPYTITWLDDDGTVIDTTTVDYDSMPTHADAFRVDDADYHYVFTGWTPEIVMVTGDATYTATYDYIARTYGEPVWTWDDVTGATAAFTTNDGYDSFTLTEDAEITSVTTTEETCEETGVETYTATVTFRGADYSNDKTAVRPALGHDYNYTYAWSTDCSKVVARRICGNDRTHTDYERVETSSEVTKDASCTQEGEITYTATFTKDFFPVQIRTVATPKIHTGSPNWIWLDNETVLAEILCINCGELFDTITADVTSEVATEPTCTEDGERVYTATVEYDGETLTDTMTESIEKLGHTLTSVDEVPPTCTETGSIACWICDTCGKHYADADGMNELAEENIVIDAKGHTEVSDAAVPPTCTETGLTEGEHCSVCSEVLVAQEVVPAAGHTEVIDAAVPQTCTETGLTEGKHCTTCGEVTVAQTVVPASGHTLTAHEANAPTCTESGNSAYWSCDVCGKFFSDKDGTNMVEADSWVTSAAGHNFGEPAWTWADDYSTAIATFVCGTCGYSTAILVHDIDEVTVPATEESDGSITYTATVSIGGKKYTKSEMIVLEYRKLWYTNFTIVGVSDEFNPDMEEEIICVTETIEGKFTITYSKACVVAVKMVDEDGIEHYERMMASATEEDNTYSFDLTGYGEWDSNIEIVVAVKGDLTGDGAIKLTDVNRLKTGALRSTSQNYDELDNFQKLVGDTNGDNSINGKDVNALKTAALRTTSYYYLPLEWDLDE